MSAGEGRRTPSPSGTGVRVYVGLLVVLAVLAVLLSWRVDGPPRDLFALGVLAVFSMLGLVRREIVLESSRVTISLTSILLLSSAVILGPVGAAVVGLASSLIAGRPARPVVRLFHACLYVLNGALGGLVVLLVNGGVRISETQSASDLITRIALPLLIADIASALTNALMLAIVVRLSAGVSIRAQVLSLLSTSGPAYLAYGVIGFLFAVLWVPAGLGATSTVLVMAPLIVARWAFAQYAEEQSAHDRTLAALVLALERKDPRTAGHGERVAQLCDWTAQSLQLGPSEQQAVRTAGMLHDLGRIAVPSRVLTATGPLSDAEILLLADHPRTAVDMLQGIGFIAQALEAIAHHHERFDGLGYPDGLAGQDIPLGARIIAAADAFDALTTQRPYRRSLSVREAIAVLQTRSPDHLDPAVVDALVRGVFRHAWDPQVFEEDDPRAQPTVLDHDDLEASDALAARSDLRRRIAERHVSGPSASGGES